MEVQAKVLAAEHEIAWVRPTLDNYVSHDVLEGLHRLPSEPASLSEAELARLDELDKSFDEHAAILECEEIAEEAIAAAEATIDAIERETDAIRDRPLVLDSELRPDAGMILTLGRDGTLVLQPHYYTENAEVLAADDDAVEVVSENTGTAPRRATLSKRLVGELAMQRRDVLALHVASDPALALGLLVFTLADADTHDWRARSATTLRGPIAAGPVIGFQAKDAPATAALAELTSGLDESWRGAGDIVEHFKALRLLDEEARACWLGCVVSRTFEASLNMAGDRAIALHDHLGSDIGIEIASWWRPTAANYFDRVSKSVILELLSEVGGSHLVARFAASKKGELAESAERVFSGNFITDEAVREAALGWVPEIMRFATRMPRCSMAVMPRCWPKRAASGGAARSFSTRLRWSAMPTRKSWSGSPICLNSAASPRSGIASSWARSTPENPSMSCSRPVSRFRTCTNIRARAAALRDAQHAAQAGQTGEALRHLGDKVVEVAEGAALSAAAAWLELAPPERERTAIYASGRTLRGAVNEAVQIGL